MQWRWFPHRASVVRDHFRHVMLMHSVLQIWGTKNYASFFAYTVYVHIHTRLVHTCSEDRQCSYRRGLPGDFLGASWGLIRKCTNSITCISSISAFSEMNCNNSCLFIHGKKKRNKPSSAKSDFPSFLFLLASQRAIFSSSLRIDAMYYWTNAFPKMNSTNFSHCLDLWFSCIG